MKFLAKYVGFGGIDYVEIYQEYNNSYNVLLVLSDLRLNKWLLQETKEWPSWETVNNLYNFGGAMNQILATYHFQSVDVDIVGCADEKTPEGKFDFYDLYVDGECINEGNPFFEWPTWEKAREFLS